MVSTLPPTTWTRISRAWSVGAAAGGGIPGARTTGVGAVTGGTVAGTCPGGADIPATTTTDRLSRDQAGGWLVWPMSARWRGGPKFVSRHWSDSGSPPWMNASMVLSGDHDGQYASLITLRTRP